MDNSPQTTSTGYELSPFVTPLVSFPLIKPGSETRKGAEEASAQLESANWKNSWGLKLFEAEWGEMLFMTFPSFDFLAGNGRCCVCAWFGVVCWSNEKFVRQ